jgi:1-acyl-sn-glycerol-3-phosphate acyltransferase
MNGFLRHPLRVSFRGLWLATELGISAFNFVWMVGLGKESRDLKRTKWLQLSSRRILRVFNVSLKTTGSLPSSGFLACNHLSYLDILVVATATPCLFVAKREVGAWPLLGWFARRAGCLFVDREKRSDVARLNQHLQQHLEAGLLLVLFPEGTSSDGQTVLPFKSSLLEPAATTQKPIFAGRIDYEIQDGNVGQEVCYWGDMTLVPHLINLLSKRKIAARLNFSDLTGHASDRKELARQLRSRILSMRPTNLASDETASLELKPA